MLSPTLPVSMSDMLKVYARPYVRLGASLRMVHATAVKEEHANKRVSGNDLKFLLQELDRAIAACDQLGMDVSASLLTSKETEYKKDPPTYGQARHSFEHLEQTVRAEMKGRWLLTLRPERMKYYQHGPAPMGPRVAKRFAKAAYDIREAHKCFALERHTAAVFHLMRVLEKGISALATDVGITLDPAFENWQNILDQVDVCARKKYEAMAKGPAKAEAQERYGKATAEFRHFQVAWRNHVSHGRGQYEAEEAETVMRHVRSFMRHLATWLAE